MVPVTEEMPVPVMPLSLDAPWWKSKEVSVPVISGGGASILTAIGGISWQNLLIIIIGLAGFAGFFYCGRNADLKFLAKQVEGIA